MAGSDADAAILAQIRALQARLSTNDDELATPSSQPSGSRTAAPPSSSTAGVLVPDSPTRVGQASSSRPQQAGPSSSSSAYLGPEYISSRVQTGVDDLVRQAKAVPRAPRPRPQWFLNHAASLQAQSQQAREASSQSKSLSRDDRLALMESLDLKPGPIDFGTGQHKEYEPYSGQRFSRDKRWISHDEFQESVMHGRYFLSPSQLYSIRVPALGRAKGADGDYDVPVPGDFVIIVTITSASESILPKRDEEDPFGEEGMVSSRLVDEEEWLTGKRNEQGTDSAKTYQANRLTQRKAQRTALRFFDLQDLSDRPEDDGEARGDDRLKLMVKKAERRDKDMGEWIGGSRGAFEKLEAETTGGAVIALINPILLGDRKKKAVKPGQQAENDTPTNEVMTIMPRDAESLYILGRCKDYAECSAQRSDGTKCGKFVDRRQLVGGARATALCSWHLDHGASRAHKGRQELQNTTSSFFGGGGMVGYDSRGSARNKRGSGGGGWSRGGRKSWDPPKRKAFSSEISYGFDSSTAPGRPQFILDNTARRGEEIKRTDERSQLFCVRDAYGREKEEKELRKRKREEEAAVLLELERKRAGYAPIVPSQSQRSAAGADDGAETAFSLPTHSTGALAIADAQRTLMERKEKAAKKAAAIAGSGRSARHAGPLPDAEGDDPLSQPFPSFASSQQGSQQRWRHSASAIKLMGFDPLSDSRSRQNRTSAASTATATGRTSSLLTRHSATNAQLGEAKLSLKRQDRRKSGVRAPSGQEAKQQGGGNDDDDGLEII
ncbi:hypothetical protein BDZ90DRAFT_233475 [Jaminaea rosea]|uniref:Zinc finger Mcm10/DnaG-type domain-containing protein n=1 Tax=Jaminaea rosea TaxID=1569628 RepID=A0A316UM60_9BASI|nr:hypothetical protein BDZ90DRAFT_233475 [Jaminaea rosea]PWN26347.1 hypothetical protein BDZ90DRAFT_233475 [Jaminaea rosea]